MTKIKNFLTDYSGFIGFALSLIVAYILPYFWATDQNALFGATVYLGVTATLLAVVVTLLNRIQTFYKKTESVSRLLILYIELILIFSSVYMWLFIFGQKNQIDTFSQMTLITKDGFVFSNYIKELTLVAIDSFHFSVVTGTTLGYGDMVPNHWISKLVVDFQVLTTVWVVILGYGNAAKKHNKNLKSDN